MRAGLPGPMARIGRLECAHDFIIKVMATPSHSFWFDRTNKVIPPVSRGCGNTGISKSIDAQRLTSKTATLLGIGTRQSIINKYF